MPTAPAVYRVRLHGRLDRAALAALLPDLEVTTDDTSTWICGRLDQAALHGILERARILGLDVLEVRPARGTGSAGGTGGVAARAAP